MRCTIFVTNHERRLSFFPLADTSTKFFLPSAFAELIIWATITQLKKLRKTRYHVCKD